MEHLVTMKIKEWQILAKISMDPRDIMLSKSSQIQENTPFMIPFIGN